MVDAELRHPRMHRAKRRRSSRQTKSRLAHPTLDEVNGSPVTLIIVLNGHRLIAQFQRRGQLLNSPACGGAAR